MGVPQSIEPDGAPVRPEALDFSTSFDDLYRSAFRAVYKLTGNRDDAAEHAQEALTRAFAKWDDLSDVPHARAWVIRVAVNQAISRWRRVRTAQRKAGLGPAVTQSDVFADVRHDLERALLKLPRRQRQIIALRYLADQSEADVARELGISVGAVKSGAARGLEKVRATLGDNFRIDAP